MSKKLTSVLLTILILATQGCATGAKTGAMISELSEETLITSDSLLYNAIEVGDVSGGQDTNPAWASKVSNDNFADALENSLKLHSMSGIKNNNYVVNANLKELKQPLLGFDMKVTAIAAYELIDKESQTTLFTSEITTPYTATVGDALLGVKRLRLANEGAIKENIREFITQLINHFSSPSPSPQD